MSYWVAASARMLAVFEHVEDAIFIKDADGRYELINPAGARMLGRSQEEVVGSTDVELFGPEAAGEITAIDAELLRAGTSRTYTGRRRIGDRERLLFTTKVPFVDPDRDRPYMIGISRDVTEQTHLEERVVAAEQQSIIGALAGGIAHELNTPLTHLLGGLDAVDDAVAGWSGTVRDLQELLEREVGAERAAALFERARVWTDLSEMRGQIAAARRGADRVRELASGLARFGRPPDGALVSVDVNDCLAAALDILSAELRYRASVVRELGDVPRVRGRAQQLSQALLHLLMRAAQSIPAGDVASHEVRVTTRRDGDSVCVEIRSSGLGLVDVMPEPAALAIARCVAADHDGDFACHAGPRGGSVASLRIPIGEVSARLPAADLERPASSRRARILLVDDDHYVRDLVRRLLGDAHEYVEAACGAEAIEVLEVDDAFDAVITDLMMPHVTGDELYAWIGEHRPALAERTIFITAGAFTDRGRAFVDRTDRPVVAKPFDRDALRAAFEAMRQRED